jgi:hypothetical protein
MPSQIANGNNIVDIAANYLVSKPSTQFGTRQLTVLKVEIAGVFVNYANSDSLFSKSVRAIQQTAEVWAVFTPVDDTTDYFHVIIATDTQYVGDSETSRTAIPSGGLAPTANFGIFETAIAAGNGGVTATVTVPTGFVAPFHG